MIISQSKVKNFEAATCLRKWKAESTGEVTRIPNEYMLRGLFFEQLCLGKSAHDQGVIQLPKLKDGRDSMVEIRLKSQSRKFSSLFNPESPEFMGFFITDTQVVLQDGDRDGTIDFVCKQDDKISVWDLKSTEDLNKAWSDPGSLDLIQQGWYRHLYRKNYSIDPELYVIVFDYSPAERVKLIKIDISEDTMARYLQRFDAVEDRISELEMLEEFPRVPNYLECSKCSLKCPVRAITQTIEFEQISL